MIENLIEMPLSNNQLKTKFSIEDTFLILSATTTALMLGWVLLFCGYGLDFTDEGFYLVWISNPFNYSLSATQFGFIYHPLYELVDGNIAALRRANVLITFSLAWTLCNIFIKNVYGKDSLEFLPRLIISAAISTASLVFLQLWLPTPSYNWLNFQALLVAVIGLLLADKNTNRISVTGWFLIGVGGWLAFMAKPTTAAALGLCVLFYLLGARKFTVRLLLISLTTAAGLLVVSALIIDGSISTFILRLKGGGELAKLIDPGYQVSKIFRVDSFRLSVREVLVLIISTATFFYAVFLSQSKRKILLYGITVLLVVFVTASLAIIFGFIPSIDDGHFKGLLIWSIPFAASFLVYASCQFKGLSRISRPHWALAYTLLLLPHVFAFGTGNNYWWQASLVGVFWILASFILLTPMITNLKSAALLLPLGLCVQLMTIALINTGIEMPYRQPHSLRENNYKIEINKSGSFLIFSQDFGQYFADAINLANHAQFEKGTPMIDLSGQSPTLLYAIGASNLGQAWIIGGYTGSNIVAAESLKNTSCEVISRAWLLMEPEGPLKLSTEILSAYGAEFERDYQVVGTIKTAEGAGGFQQARMQKILKPIRSAEVAIQACVRERVINP